MRILLRVCLALLLLLIVTAIAASVLLPRWIDSPAFRDSVAQLAEAQIGRKVVWKDLGFGLLPPSIVVEGASVAGESAAAPPLLQAAAIELRLSLWPLLAGVVLVDKLAVEGAAVELDLDADGLSLPVLRPSEPPPAGEPAAAPVTFAARRVTLKDSRLVLVDRRLTPPITWALEKLWLEAEATSLEAPIVFEGGGALAGGALGVKGSATLRGEVEAVVSLDSIRLDAVAPYVGSVDRLAGALSGRATLSAGSAGLSRAEVALEIAGLDLQSQALGVTGPLAIDVDLSSVLPAQKGRIRVDASQARVFADSFEKAPGVALHLSGGLERSEQGAILLDIESLVLASLQAKARLQTGAATTLTISAPAFEVAPVAALVPALAAFAPRGRLALQGLGVRVEPFELTGALLFDGLALELAPERGLVVLRGRAEGKADGIRLADCTLEAGGGLLAVSGGVADLPGQQRFDLQFTSQGVLQVNPLVSTFSSVKDTVYGPLVVQGRLAGRAGGVERDALLQSLEGGLEFELGEGASAGAEGGRIKGVSLLRLVFDQLGALGGAALLAVPAATGKSLDEFYDDRFRLMQGSFEVRDGNLVTRRLRIVYPDYGAEVGGSLRMLDQALDMTGQLELGPQIVSRLGGESGGGAVLIPIASIRGTLAEPKVAVAKEAVGALVRRFLLDGRVMQEATRQLDRVLPGVSDILKGGRSR